MHDAPRPRGSPQAASSRRPLRGRVILGPDALPNARGGALELRARLVVESDVEPRAGLRFRLAATADGVLADRGGLRRDATADVQDAYVDIERAAFDLRAGLARLVWGRLDEVAPGDVVNPLELSRFFFEGRAEARLPVPLVRARIFFAPEVVLEGVYVAAFRRGRFDRLDEPRSPFNLEADALCPPGVACTPPPIVRREPGWSLRHAQGGVRFAATSGGVDWALAAYRGFRPFGVYRAAIDPASRAPYVRQDFPRFTMIAGDVETARGAWVVRGEAAAFVDDVLQRRPDVLPVSGRSIDFGAGVDRRFGALQLSTSVMVHDERPRVRGVGTSPPATDLTLVAVADRPFRRERYRTRAFVVWNPAGGSIFVRDIFTAALSDDVSVEGSVGWFLGKAGDAIGRFADRDFLYVRVVMYF
ncbi:MAG TPA: DUF1302 family protein [Vicinamibacterales bacterium]|nr:DUF1302 family protein [Vicinamibacterales bacterium]